MHMETHAFKVQYEMAGLDIIRRIKELESSSEWVQIADQPCDKFKISIGPRTAAKGVHIVPFPMEQVIQFLKQEESLKKLNPMLIEIKVLEEKLNVFKVHYMHYKGVWPVAGRDFVNLAVPFFQNKQKLYIGTKMCDYPYPEQKGVVRAEVIIGAYIIEKIDEGHTKVTYIADADLKGNIPYFFSNALAQFQAGIAHKVEEVMKNERK